MRAATGAPRVRSRFPVRCDAKPTSIPASGTTTMTPDTDSQIQKTVRKLDTAARSLRDSTPTLLRVSSLATTLPDHLQIEKDFLRNRLGQDNAGKCFRCNLPRHRTVVCRTPYCCKCKQYGHYSHKGNQRLSHQKRETSSSHSHRHSNSSQRHVALSAGKGNK